MLSCFKSQGFRVLWLLNFLVHYLDRLGEKYPHLTNGGNEAQKFGAQRQKLGSLKAACVPGETGMHPHPISVSTDGSLRSSQGPF